MTDLKDLARDIAKDIAREDALRQVEVVPGERLERHYAVFHRVLRAAAQRFAVPEQEHGGAYQILYRSFGHGQMKQTREDLAKSTLPKKIRWSLRRDAVSQETRDFAVAFPALREIREFADYDPTASRGTRRMLQR